MFPGPGHWTHASEPFHLREWFAFAGSVRSIRLTSIAARCRVALFENASVDERMHAYSYAYAEAVRRPAEWFHWLHASPIHALHDALAECAGHGIGPPRFSGLLLNLPKTVLVPIWRCQIPQLKRLLSNDYPELARVEASFS